MRARVPETAPASADERPSGARGTKAGMAKARFRGVSEGESGRVPVGTPDGEDVEGAEVDVTPPSSTKAIAGCRAGSGSRGGTGFNRMLRRGLSCVVSTYCT